GYLLHKYNPDGSLGCSWHAWSTSDGRLELPIQEDETGLPIWALWQHYERDKDIEFVRPLYRKLVRAGADFMATFREPRTKLPAPSFDLWEERRGIHAWTAAAVVAGLTAARNLDVASVPGNPWFISTLWLAEWYIATARSLDDLERPRALLDWCRTKALPSGVLAEQVHPYTGEPLSVSPLTWSHAAFVSAVQHFARASARIHGGMRDAARRAGELMA